MQCAALTVPVTATRRAFYAMSATSETTYSVREWTDTTGRNLLTVQFEWSMASTPLLFPVVATVSSGQTASWVVMFFWTGCSADLSTCKKQYLVYNGVITVGSASRAPLGSIAASSDALSLQETDSDNYVLPGTCLAIGPLDWGATYACRSDGDTCASASDCCTNSCQAGICGGLSCNADGFSCTSPAQCCSGQCSSGACGAPACKSDGNSCTSAPQCCTGLCSSGVCGAPVCRSDGLYCTSASQCCSSLCSSGVCGAPACKADGYSCTSASQCCTGMCSSGVCGAPACKTDGYSCTSASQCCSSQCSSGVCGAPACKSDGYSCTSASQCCSYSCSSGVCGTGTTSCNPVSNTGCSSGNECILSSSETVTCAIAGYGTEGDTCSAFVTCAGGYGCFAGTCRKICRKSTGAGCSSGSVCTGVTGWTTYGACS